MGKHENMKTLCITGVNGQLGSYLTELFLSKGYKVYGLKRRSSTLNTQRIDHIYKDPHLDSKLELVYGDLSDATSVIDFVLSIKPDIFINTSAQPHVRVSFDIPEYTMDITGTGVIRCLEAIRKYSPNTRFVQCSSSEMFGSTPPPQNEETKFRPRSPYGVAKVAGYYATINYREAYNLFASNAIMYNYESARRGETFVTRKITRAATRIKLGLQDKLYLGNLEARRDWGHAMDTANAVYLIATADRPDDYVISTGVQYSVRDFVNATFSRLNLDPNKYIEFDAKYLRPSEVDSLQGDSTKIKKELGWEPKYSFEQLVDEMVSEDLKSAEEEKLIQGSK
jgi:GDPmannose 4,6-dehydratase